MELVMWEEDLVRFGVNVSSTTDTAWFSLNPVSGTAVSTPTNTEHMHTRVHTHTSQHTYKGPLQLKINIEVFYSRNQDFAITPKEVTSCNFPPCGATQRGAGGRAIRRGRMQAGRKCWGYVLTFSSPNITPHPCHMACCTCSKMWTDTQSTPPWLSPGTTSIHNPHREQVVPNQIAFPDPEKILKSQQAFLVSYHCPVVWTYPPRSTIQVDLKAPPRSSVSKGGGVQWQRQYHRVLMKVQITDCRACG